MTDDVERSGGADDTTDSTVVDESPRDGDASPLTGPPPDGDSSAQDEGSPAGDASSEAQASPEVDPSADADADADAAAPSDAVDDDVEATDESDDESDDESAVDGTGEPFTRYTNSMFRVITIAGAALVLVLGTTVAVVSRTVSPPAPAVLTLIAVVLTIVLVAWYLTGLHIALDVYDDHLVVARKIGSTRIERRDVAGVELDRGWRGALLFSGRPLRIHLHDDSVVLAYGCLPSDSSGQQEAYAELSALLGAYAAVAVVQDEVSMQARIDAMTKAARERTERDDS